MSTVYDITAVCLHLNREQDDTSIPRMHRAKPDEGKVLLGLARVCSLDYIIPYNVNIRRATQITLSLPLPASSAGEGGDAVVRNCMGRILGRYYAFPTVPYL